MADATLKLELDPRQAVNALGEIRAAQAEVEDGFEELEEAGSDLFEFNNVGEFVQDVEGMSKAMDKGSRAMRNLTKFQKFLEVQQKRTTDPKIIRQYSDEIARTEVAMAALKRRGVDTWQSIGKASDEAGKRQSKTSKIFAGLGGALARALPVLSLSAVVAGAIQAAGAYEQTRVSFEAFLKSAGKADKLLGDLNAASQVTPFTAQDFEGAAKSLLAVGFAADTIVPNLNKIAEISAATGKNFNELAVIFSKARSAGVLYAQDINQLIDAGIPIIDEFSKILGTTPDQVKKLASQGKISFSVLEQAFTNLTATGGQFEGLLRKQSQTLPGLTSTLSGAYQDLLRAFGGDGFLSRISKNLVRGLTTVFRFISNTGVPVTKSLQEETRDLQAEFNAEIEVLKRGNFTQEERAQLIGEINTKYKEYLPNLISETASIKEIAAAQKLANDEFAQKILFIAFEEEYAEILKKSAQAARGALSAERDRQALINEAGNVGLGGGDEKLGQVFEDRQAALQGFRDAGLRVVEETPEQLAKLDKDFASIAARFGTTIDALRKKFAAPVTDPATGQTTNAAKAADTERKRQQLRLQILEAGREKEVSSEQNRFTLLLADLNKYFAGRDELQSVIEQAEEQHRNNLVTINEKFDTSELVSLRAADAARQSLRASLLEEGTQKEIAEEKGRFAKVRAEIEKQFAESAELPGILEAARVQHIANLNSINEEGVISVLETEKDLNDQELALAEAQAQRVILLLRQRGASEAEVAEVSRQFDLAIQKKRLEAEIRFQEAILAATGEGDADRITQIRNSIATLNEELGNINIEIDTPTTGDGKPFNFAELLGIDDEKLQAAQKVANALIQSISTVSAARLAAAETELRIAQDKVSAAEDALQEEQDLAEEGFANNIELRERELAAAKKIEAAALQEKRKAAKEAAAIDTAQQAISLITAAADIFQSLAKFGPIGIGIAIGTIATMFAAFAKVKISAARAAKLRGGGTGTVSDSGVVIGKRHSRGGVPLEVEGGEFFGTDGKRFGVVKKEMTKKHFDLLQAINSNDRSRIGQLAHEIGTAPTFALSRGSGARVAASRAQSRAERQTAEVSELKKSNVLLQRNNTLLHAILTGKPERTSIPGGYQETRPGLVKIVRDGKR